MSRIIVFVLLILGIIFSVYLVSQKTQFFSKASIDTTPKNITVSNISERGFTVSWVTDKPSIGIVRYAQDLAYNLTAYDERDQADPQPRGTHFVVLNNLLPQQSYNLKIEEQTLQQTTAMFSENTPPLPTLAFGKLKKGFSEVPQEAIIYLKLPGSTTLSTYITEDGNWLITVSNAKTADLSSYVNVKDGDMAEIWADGAKGSLKNTQIKINSNESLDDLTLSEPVLSSPLPQSASYNSNIGIGNNAPDSANWIEKMLTWFKKILRIN